MMSKSVTALCKVKHAGTELPPIAELLTAGGDMRIALAAPAANARSVNQYGCTALPDPELLALGSSTASAISPEGYAAAEHMRSRLVCELENVDAEVVYMREMERTRQELMQLCGLAGMSGLEVVMAASGTDAHLIASHLLATHEGGRSLVVMVEGAETGSGVPLALAACHFSGRTALGTTVDKGQAMSMLGMAVVTDMEVAGVPVRHADGTPRASAEVDTEFAKRVRAGCANGQQVLLVLSDVTKSGLIAPSPACALALKQELKGQVAVLVDACQFRMSSQTLRSYLEQDCMVALTGSKFLGGPPFSGALFLPHAIATRLHARPVPHSLREYSAAGDWPRGWDTRGLSAAHNFGLLLRWEAALHELRSLRAVAEEDLAAFLRTFAQAVQRRLEEDAVFVVMCTPALQRTGLSVAADWDTCQTIFPFFMLHGDGSPLNREETAQVYRLLQKDLGGQEGMAAKPALYRLRCQLGQPVAGGERDGVAVSALRLCVSARLIVEAVRTGRQEEVVGQALAALDKAAMLAQGLRVRGKGFAKHADFS